MFRLYCDTNVYDDIDKREASVKALREKFGRREIVQLLSVADIKRQDRVDGCTSKT